MELALFALLACPVGMGVMMWMMSRNNQHRPTDREDTATPGTDREIAALRAEMDALREQNRRERHP